MTHPVKRSPGAKGLYFLACFACSPLIGWGLVALFGAAGGTAAGTILVLPAVVLLGYGLWHARRIIRTIRMRVGGARSVPDDPVAEHAEGAFVTAGRVMAIAAVVLLWLAHGVALAVATGIAAIVWGMFLGRAARDGRLPAPEFE